MVLLKPRSATTYDLKDHCFSRVSGKGGSRGRPTPQTFLRGAKMGMKKVPN